MLNLIKRGALFALPVVAASAALVSLESVSNDESVQARIKLATLPAKENVNVDFNHASYTLVEEDREIALQAGENTVDFSWAGTAIDKSSIVFRPLTPDPEVRVLSTSYPPGENALTWAVYADNAKSVVFRVSYLMGNIGRETSYQVFLAEDEQSASFKHYFKINNASGEDFDDTTFVLNGGQTFERSIENGEAKRVLAKRYEDVKVRKEYVFDRNRNSEATLTDFVFPNTAETGLGQQSFDYGKVRIYQMKTDKDAKGEVITNSDGSPRMATVFMGEDWGKFTPVGEEMRLYTGVAQDIKIERKQMVYEKENVRGNVYDTDEVIEFEIKNFKKQPVEVIIVERVGGEWEIMNDSTAQPYKRESNEEVHFKVMVQPFEGGDAKGQIFRFHYQRKDVW